VWRRDTRVARASQNEGSWEAGGKGEQELGAWDLTKDIRLSQQADALCFPTYMPDLQCTC
jgi:hypothetical protein